MVNTELCTFELLLDIKEVGIHSYSCTTICSGIIHLASNIAIIGQPSLVQSQLEMASDKAGNHAQYVESLISKILHASPVLNSNAHLKRVQTSPVSGSNSVLLLIALKHFHQAYVQ